MITTDVQYASPSSDRMLHLFQTAFHRDPTPEELRIFIIGKHYGVADLALSKEKGPFPNAWEVKLKAVRLAGWVRADRAARELAPRLARPAGFTAELRSRKGRLLCIELTAHALHIRLVSERDDTRLPVRHPSD